MLKNLPNNLYPGLIVPIYIQQDNGQYRYEFDAELIKHVPSWREREPFNWEERKPEKDNINAVKECWKVRVVSDSPFENGVELIRWIPRFHSNGLIRIVDNKPPEPPENDDW